MSDHLMRGVRVQLTTTMDSVLRTAVFEVMRIFESALYNHKMEMAQKGEEIAQLTVKLQTAELKLKDFELRNPRGAEINKTQTESEDVPDALGQSTTVPEIDVEVPDDWCAPLGYDTVTKQEDGFCPSVDNCCINLQRSPVERRSKRISTKNENPKPTQDKLLPVCDKANWHPKTSGDLGKLLKGLNQDYCNLRGLDRLRKRKMSDGTFTDKEDSSKHKNKQGIHNANESKAAGPQELEIESRNKYSCGTCYRVFGTKPGLGVHVRSQRKCKGCKMVFCFRGAAKYHLEVCEKNKALMNKRCRHPAKTKPDEGNALSSSKAKVIIKKGSTQSSVDNKKTSSQTLSCRHCSFKTNIIRNLKKHMLTHSDELLTCSICPRKFDQEMALKVHITKKHGVCTPLANKNGKLGWTKPLENADKGGGIQHGQ
ncbi:zinc finger protein 37-like isoform X2 [Girardinichthys multiradiatus]|uniref:zinc finger protein 37-like isoform X2 n=1 Tax=Girardinichthys multiradiatus TaxID=208333 RepID=UPI001FADF7B6|nr:zinc finger protein 37-like isoform X2 [Girardinichthys multiradiatus]